MQPSRPADDAFHFLWGYDPQYWRGLRKHGLIDAHAGVRLVQCLYTPRMRCFNQWAAPGSPLHREVWGPRRPLLIDRGTGGIAHEDYPFDRRLMEAYARRLGSRLLGVQFHEWACNVANDWDRLRRVLGPGRVEPGAIQERFDWRTPDTCLETGDPHDFAGQAFPATVGDFAGRCRDYLQRKFARYQGRLACVPSQGMAYVEAIRWGAGVVMPEHGHHIPMGRVHTAAARGAVRQAGRGQWGSYYAPWGNRPDSVTCYTDFNLWYLGAEILCGESFRHRGNGGSSRAFQRRLFHWAYLTGARYLAEEWGPENTFHDWKDFDLTPYGQVVRDFLRFVNRTGRGQPVVPAAVVIDSDWFGLDAYFMAGRHDRIQRFYPPKPADEAAAEFFRHLVGCQDSPPNDDARVLTASAMPDAFDLLTDQAGADVLGRYRVLAYVGEHPGRLRRKLRGWPGRLIEMDGPEAAADALTEATLDELPVRVEGPVHWLLNRRRGSWQIGLFNPRGVTVDFSRPEQSDPAAAAEVTVTLVAGRRRAGPARLDGARVSTAAPAGSGIRRRRVAGLTVNVGPGGLVVLEI